MGTSTLRISNASATSRSIRACVAPCTRVCNASRRSSATAPGSWYSQVGAWRARVSTTWSPRGPRHSAESAPSTGRYASPLPYCSTHAPHVSHVRAEQALADDALASDRLDEVILRHQALGVGREVLQDREWLPPKLQLGAVSP